MIKISVLAIAFFVSFSGLLLAEDYPAGYLGSGFREYLSGKIQKGYYVEAFKVNDLREKTGVEKGNQIAQILGYAAQATEEADNSVLAVKFQAKDNADNLKVEITQQKQQREKVASTNIESGFTYVPYSDGHTEYFKDGLVIRIENERVVDEFGNVSIKNTNNMQYNDKRLLVSYEASLKDHLGNVTKLFWYGAAYTDDSVYYGNAKTNANRNLTEYYLKEIDSAGNVKLTHWKAASYEGKFLRAFSQTIDDSIYGHASFTRTDINYAGGDPTQMTSYHEEGVGTDNLAYSLQRDNITYNGKGQTTGYHEEKITTQIDGKQEKTIVDAEFKYTDTAYTFGPDLEPEADRLIESSITARTENADGSYKTEKTTTKYNYTGTQLTAASGHNEFNGQESKWFAYTDAQGHTLSRNVDKDGKITYSYVDPDTLKTVNVAEGQVTATLKEGNKYSGSSDMQFEILFGTPMVKTVHSLTSFYTPYENKVARVENSTLTYDNGLVNNLIRVLGNREHTETSSPLSDPANNHSEVRDINLTYTYDALGNLSGAKASGTGSGWEYSGEKGWYGKYTSTITSDYDILLGKALRKMYHEDKNYQK